MSSVGVKIKVGLVSKSRIILPQSVTSIEHNLPNIDPSCAQSLIFDLCDHKTKNPKKKRTKDEMEDVDIGVVAPKKESIPAIKHQQHQPLIERSSSGPQVEIINGKMVVKEASLVITYLVLDRNL